MLLLTLTACSSGDSENSIWEYMDKSKPWGHEDLSLCKRYNSCDSNCNLYDKCEE
jgi:hypothetical protein